MASTHKSFIHALALGVALHAAALPAHAGGPLNDEGLIDTMQDAWLDAEPGHNPLNAVEAAAAFAVISACIHKGELVRERVDLGALAADVVAGGNNLSDFKDGGKHRDLLLGYLRPFGAKLRDAADSLMLLVLCGNPYYSYSGQ